MLYLAEINFTGCSYGLLCSVCGVSVRVIFKLIPSPIKQKPVVTLRGGFKFTISVHTVCCQAVFKILQLLGMCSAVGWLKYQVRCWSFYSQIRMCKRMYKWWRAREGSEMWIEWREKLKCLKVKNRTSATVRRVLESDRLHTSKRDERNQVAVLGSEKDEDVCESVRERSIVQWNRFKNPEFHWRNLFTIKRLIHNYTEIMHSCGVTVRNCTLSQWRRLQWVGDDLLLRPLI